MASPRPGDGHLQAFLGRGALQGGALERVYAHGAGGAQPVVTLTNVYDATGDRRTVTDSLGGVTSYTYDLAARLTASTSPATGPTEITLSYAAAGRPTAIARPNAILTDLVFDLAGKRWRQYESWSIAENCLVSGTAANLST